MTSSQRKRRARLNQRAGLVLKRRALFELEVRAWDQMPAGGREFGSPDFDRLMEEDFQPSRGVFDPAVEVPGETGRLGIETATLPTIEARTRSKAADLVMGGTSWLTAADMPSHAIPLLAKWLAQGRIFALEQEGV